MTACNFNNVYAVLLPKVNTVINYRVPNFVNDAVKQEMREMVAPFKGLTHNLVLIDPLYRAFTFGSTELSNTDFNPAQLQNKLVLVRSKNSKYSVSSLKNSCVDIIKSYFKDLRMGDSVDVAELSSQIAAIKGLKQFYISDSGGRTFNKL